MTLIRNENTKDELALIFPLEVEDVEIKVDASKDIFKLIFEPVIVYMGQLIAGLMKSIASGEFFQAMLLGNLHYLEESSTDLTQIIDHGFLTCFSNDTLPLQLEKNLSELQISTEALINQ